MKRHLLFFIFWGIIFSSNSQILSVPTTNGGPQKTGGMLVYDTNEAKLKSVFNGGSFEENDIFTGEYRVGNMYFDESQNAIYGVVGNGGTANYEISNQGLVFKYEITKKNFTILKRFSELNAPEHGYKPTSALVSYNGKLYGMCELGGLEQSPKGLIYYIDTKDDSYHVEFNFDGATTGGMPSSKLWLEGDVLYGGTQESTDGKGYTVFKYNLSTQVYEIITQKLGSTLFNPIRDVMVRNDVLYFCHGAYIEEIPIFSPSNLTTYFSFIGINTARGKDPYAFAVNKSQGEYFVVCTTGGQYDKGTICKMTFSGPKIVNVWNFNLKGQFPRDGLTDLGKGNMAGACYEYNNVITGGIFKFDYNYNVDFVHQFSTSDGETPVTKPVKAGNKLYGYTSAGGDLNVGTWYSMDINAIEDGITIEQSLGYPKGRSYSYNIASSSDEKIKYGVAVRGGKNGQGGIVKINTETNEVLELFSVTNNEISQLISNLILYKEKYYGVALLTVNASNTHESLSAIYEFDPEAKSYKIISTLDQTNLSVALPRSSFKGNLALNNSKLYGCTQKGLFSVDIENPATATYLKEFTPGVEGQNTNYISLQNDKLYGVNQTGGNQQKGTFFTYDLTTNSFEITHNFDATIASPAAGFFLKENTVYGLFSEGGDNDKGGIYKLELTTPSTITQEVAFDNTSGYNPSCQLFKASNEKYYTVTSLGGTENKGSLLEFEPDKGITVLANLNETTGYDTNHAMFSEYTIPTAIEEVNKKETNFTIYPNPTTGKLFFSETIRNEKITIFNLSGVKVFEKSLDSENSIDISNLASGIYLINIDNNSYKIIKR